MPLWAGASQTFGMAEHFTGLRFGSMDDSLCSGELSTVKLRNDSARLNPECVEFSDNRVRRPDLLTILVS
jgi:hypothetical protein